MPKHRERLLRSASPRKTASSDVSTQTTTSQTDVFTPTQQMMNMQRVVGNQASLRLLRTSSGPVSIQQRAPKGYMKRMIQRNIMPYDTWKDYSDGGMLSIRPEELKTVDGIFKTYKDLQAQDQAAALRLIVVNLKKYRQANGGENSKGWKKNKRSEAVDTLIAQIEEDQAMQQNNLQTVQLMGVSEFTSLTEQKGGWFFGVGNAGQSGFQKEIIKCLTDFHELKDPTGTDLDKALALLYKMRDFTGYWQDQNLNNGKRNERRNGMNQFGAQVDGAITLLEGYLGGQITGAQGKSVVAQMSTVVPQGGKSEEQQKQERINKLKLTHEGGAESLFAKLGALISEYPGTKTEINVEVKIPIQHGIFLGAHLKVSSETDTEIGTKEVEKNGKKENEKTKTNFCKIHSDLTATFGWEIPKIVELKAEVGGYLEARGETPKEAMLLISYAFYRRLMDAKYASSVTRRAAGLIWGGYTGKSGIKMAELWGKKVEKTALDKDIAYAESGGTGILGAKVGSKATVVDLGAKYQYFNGRKYTKKTVQAQKDAIAYNKTEQDPTKHKKERAYDNNKWHEMKLEVGLAGIFRSELKVKIPTRTKSQIEAAKKKSKDAIKKNDDALKSAQSAYDLADQEVKDAEQDVTNAAQQDVQAQNLAADKLKDAKAKRDKAKETLDWWKNYVEEQKKVVGTEKDPRLPLNLEFESFTIFTIGGQGVGAILETIYAELIMKIRTLLFQAATDSDSIKPDAAFFPSPSELLSHSAQFKNIASGTAKDSYGPLGKDGIKAGDTLKSQSGFGLTLSCKIKEDVATWLVSIERANEMAVDLTVFKADIKERRRILAFTIKKLAMGEKNLAGKQQEVTNVEFV